MRPTMVSVPVFVAILIACIVGIASCGAYVGSANAELMMPTVTPAATPQAPNEMPTDWWNGGIGWPINGNHSNIPTGAFPEMGHVLVQQDGEDQEIARDWDAVHTALGTGGTGTIFWYPGTWYTPTPGTPTPTATATPGCEPEEMPQNFFEGGISWFVCDETNVNPDEGDFPDLGHVEVHHGTVDPAANYVQLNQLVGSNSATLFFVPQVWYTPTPGGASPTPTATPTAVPMPTNWWNGGIGWAVNGNHSNIPNTGAFPESGHVVVQQDGEDEEIAINWNAVHTALGAGNSGTIFWYPAAWYTPTPTGTPNGTVTPTPTATVTPETGTYTTYLPITQRTLVVVNAPEDFCLGGVPYKINTGEVLQSSSPCDQTTGLFCLDLDGYNRLSSPAWATIVIWAEGKPSTSWFRPTRWGPCPVDR